ncbi:hypothetical protein UC8_41900 [Roseimaritima ulvae]|uniref:Uncharacterized protein n=2 Tax=Roseimaritima ulvae TaxID=980254 RepID=A0A5B9QYE3_9BACT|nr:hypothetical protein UC8_41900 [Roseimaritima ulvae]
MHWLKSSFILTALWGLPAAAAEVDVRLSTREAVVGVPIVLQLSIHNAEDYQPPTLPDIDGCEIRSAGPPARRSQVSIINGRRSESSSDTLSYLITPRREGSFEIPSFHIQADGESLATDTLRFVATKSDSGDRLIVEITGDKEQVYVGQPLNLSLKIWLKPFRDRQRRLTLSEGDMWQMISSHSQWGSFADRIRELADGRRRPGGQEVLRTDSEGQERSYYLYEVDSTVYPTHAGSIDADEVQIVVDYPTALGPSRSPLGGLFEDDFFGSPFNNRLTITASQPIVGEARIGSTEVLPVPRDGRPDDYRGAVGQYEIVTQANPTTVDAGEPVTLNIGIAGTGPMELVQAPPLHELTDLTDDFRVADESLAGFVKQDTKLFSTTIRPRREGITAIPPIRFSYFDPDAEQFKTIYSEPISITVNPAESLAMDSIVGSSRFEQTENDATPIRGSELLPDFTNVDNPDAVLTSQVAASRQSSWWLLVVLPTLVWLAALVVKHRRALRHCLPRLRSARATCLASLQHADDGPAIVAALRQYIADRSGKPCPTNATAVGALRTLGMYPLAGEVESMMHRLDRDAGGAALLDNSSDHDEQVAQAIALVDQIESACAARGRVRLNTAKRSATDGTSKTVAQRSAGMLSAFILALTASSATAAGPVSLSPQQQRTVLAEAAQAYAEATAAGSNDSAEAQAGFEAAAAKYQLLVDSGVRNSLLYRNLANAYAQSGQRGRAIAYYERAKRLAPDDPVLSTNLQWANARVSSAPVPSSENVGADNASSVMERLLASVRAGNANVLQAIGRTRVIVVLAIASIMFWGLLTMRTLWRPFPVWRWAVLPLVAGLLCGGLLLLSDTAPPPAWNAVLVADTVTVHAGDGQAFASVQTFRDAQGQRVRVIGERGKWRQIQTPNQQPGWVEASNVLLVGPGGRVGEWESGRVGEGESGRVGEWERGRVGEWGSGGVGEWGSEE